MSKHGGYDDQPFLADLYDLVPGYASRRDLEFYLELCRSARGKVLELGCGTGRVLIPAAAEGVDIVGLDLSPHMLARCREKLAAYKVPKIYEFLESLPKSAVGKILRRELRDMEVKKGDK